MSPLLLQVMLGVLTTVSIGLAGWALKSVVTISRELAVVDTRSQTRHEEYERRFGELRGETADLRKEHLRAVSKLQATLDGMAARLGAVHTELLVIKATFPKPTSDMGGV